MGAGARPGLSVTASSLPVLLLAGPVGGSLGARARLRPMDPMFRCADPGPGQGQERENAGARPCLDYCAVLLEVALDASLCSNRAGNVRSERQPVGTRVGSVSSSPDAASKSKPVFGHRAPRGVRGARRLVDAP